MEIDTSEMDVTRWDPKEPNKAYHYALDGNEVYIIYESTSAPLRKADYRVGTIHHGPASELLS